MRKWEKSYVIYRGGVQQIVNIVYPVGISIICDHNPQNDYPWQKWTQDFKDRFPLGAGDTYKAGATGGEATHTLTVSEMPAHSHGTKSYSVESTSNNEWCLKDCRIDTPVSQLKFQWEGRNISTKGGSQPHNNMPPYQAKCFWTRTA